MNDETRILQESKIFYNKFSTKLLTDYINGNARIEAAIRLAISWIPEKANRILDIGCGMGWSTWEIKRKFPNAYTLGVDLSEQSTEIARKLFGKFDLVYLAGDIFNLSKQLQESFDAVTLIDVYEHIPKEQRDKFHSILSTVLSRQGILIMSCPTIYHQRFLREKEPKGLQPVDEDVAFQEISQLAVAINGDVSFFKYVSIWRTNDYLHAVIQKKVDYKPKGSQTLKRDLNLESQRTRRQRVKSKLKMYLRKHKITFISENKMKYVLKIMLLKLGLKKRIRSQ